MKINKDLIIENTNTSLNAVASYINNPYDILYSSSTAKTGSVTLSQNPTNYKFIVIEWGALQYTNNWKIQQTIIFSPVSGRTYNFSNCFYDHSGNKQIYVSWTNYTINGSVISVPTSDSNQAGTVGASTAYTASTPCWGILRVFGWK